MKTKKKKGIGFACQESWREIPWRCDKRNFLFNSQFTKKEDWVELRSFFNVINSYDYNLTPNDADLHPDSAYYLFNVEYYGRALNFLQEDQKLTLPRILASELLSNWFDDLLPTKIHTLQDIALFVLPKVDEFLLKLEKDLNKRKSRNDFYL